MLFPFGKIKNQQIHFLLPTDLPLGSAVAPTNTRNLPSYWSPWYQSICGGVVKPEKSNLGLEMMNLNCKYAYILKHLSLFDLCAR